jgi:NAD(P)-dependent dehydrogenase (short-subunit alcohol dehydrogenase family)
MNSPTKVALVTGAGTGIGKQVAIALLREGYSVVLAGRRPGPLEATVQETRELGTQTLVVPTDVRDSSSVRLLFTETQERSAHSIHQVTRIVAKNVIWPPR